MARNHANNGRIYRAVITLTYADGQQYTRKRGPYDTPTPAKALITAAETRAKQSHGPRRDPASAFTAVGHIECAEVVWQPIKEDSP